jgi:hypothetical protein
MCDCQDQRLSIQNNHREVQDSWDEDVTTLEDRIVRTPPISCVTLDSKPSCVNLIKCSELEFFS